jgi:hypothetical protein
MMSVLVRIIVVYPWHLILSTLGTGVLITAWLVVQICRDNLELNLEMNPESLKAINNPVTESVVASKLLETLKAGEPPTWCNIEGYGEAPYKWRILEHTPDTEKLSCIFSTNAPAGRKHNILTETNFQAMRGFEDAIMSTDFWATNCKRSPGAAQEFEAEFQRRTSLGLATTLQNILNVSTCAPRSLGSPASPIFIGFGTKRTVKVGRSTDALGGLVIDGCCSAANMTLVESLKHAHHCYPTSGNLAGLNKSSDDQKQTNRSVTANKKGCLTQ